jgi:hypothetical protein
VYALCIENKFKSDCGVAWTEAIKKLIEFASDSKWWMYNVANGTGLNVQVKMQ